MTSEVKIPDPLDLDRDEEARLRRVAGLAPAKAPAGEYAGFESVGLPERPPQTEREREVYSLEEGEMLVNMGPQHPSTHGVMRLVVKVRGEVVTDIDPVLGYLHRGIEKLCEEATYTTVLTYVDPMDYLSTMHNEHAPAIAFEKLFGVTAPQAGRVHPRAGGGAEPGLQPQPDDGLPGARHGRHHPDPVRLHQPRRDRRHAVRHQRPAHALQLLPGRRRQLGHQRRVPLAARHLAQPRPQERRDERAGHHRQRGLPLAHDRDGDPLRQGRDRARRVGAEPARLRACRSTFARRIPTRSIPSSSSR